MQPRIAIIGGGISGLAAANRVHELAPEAKLSLFETSSRLGGVIGTTHRDGFLIESAADNFMTTNPSAIKLCQRLGLGDELIPTNRSGCGAMVLGGGKLHPIPAGFLVMAPSRIMPILATRVLSPRGKLRAAMEWLVPARKTESDESLESFTCRRFGREMFDRLVQPLVGGIYTADPQRLSVAATMPRFLQMEREHGSLIRAMMRQRKTAAGKSDHRKNHSPDHGGARYSQFMALRGGMSTLIRELADSLPDGSIHLRRAIRSVVPNGSGGWSIRMEGGDPAWQEFDGVIVAAPAHHAASMLAACDQRVSDELSRIEYASCAVVSLGFERKQIGHALDSFGFVVPLAENRLILSCSFSSLKYPGRAAPDRVLLRVFIGGACQGGLLRLPKDELIELAERELRDMLQIRGPSLLQQITLQTRAMPQYHVGHLRRVERIESCLRQYTSLAIAGNSLRGVGVPGCIESGEQAAKRVVEGVRSSRRSCHELVSN